MRLFPQVSAPIRSAFSAQEAIDALRQGRFDLAGVSYCVEETGPGVLSIRPTHDGTLWSNAFVPILQVEARSEPHGCTVLVSGGLKRSAKIMMALLWMLYAVFLIAVVVLFVQGRLMPAVWIAMLLLGAFLCLFPHIGFSLTAKRVLGQLRNALTP